MNANIKQIADFALKSRLPSMYYNREAVDAGGLMSYGADPEEPTKFEFVINLQTAKHIGLTIPSDLLARATRIIR